jgi:hypothetical protein
MLQVRQPRRRRPSRKVRTSQGKVVERSTRGNPRESATETNRRRAPPHVSGGRARVKWCGKSAPASRRRGGWANPTRCKAKQDRLQVARQGPGRPLRWMAAQRRNPAYRPAKERPRKCGVFLYVESLGSCHRRLRSRRRGDLYGIAQRGRPEKLSGPRARVRRRARPGRSGQRDSRPLAHTHCAARQEWHRGSVSRRCNVRTGEHARRVRADQSQSCFFEKCHVASAHKAELRRF